MGENAVNESITIPIDDDLEETQRGNDAFPMAIREMGEALFLNYDEKTSNLSDENILGIIRCITINDYLQRRYNVRSSCLDEIVTRKKALILSRNAFGITQLQESFKAIQASFQQTDIPLTMMQRLTQRR